MQCSMYLQNIARQIFKSSSVGQTNVIRQERGDRGNRFNPNLGCQKHGTERQIRTRLICFWLFFPRDNKHTDIVSGMASVTPNPTGMSACPAITRDEYQCHSPDLVHNNQSETSSHSGNKQPVHHDRCESRGENSPGNPFISRFSDGRNHRPRGPLFLCPNFLHL